ncbi:MAG TPA: hypothetical protein VF599_05885 [Pyrinomonadaceae bacterium]|jgi:hypothetical protein
MLGWLALRQGDENVPGFVHLDGVVILRGMLFERRFVVLIMKFAWNNKSSE